MEFHEEVNPDSSQEQKRYPDWRDQRQKDIGNTYPFYPNKVLEQ
jgi:hypothetical protein